MNRVRAVSWPAAVVVVAIVVGVVLLAYSPVIRRPALEGPLPSPELENPSVVSVSRGTIRSVVVVDGAVRPEVNEGVATGRFEAVAIIPPELLYRFYEPPRSISVKLDRGPGPFECPLLSLGAIDAGSADPLAEPVELRCLIPESVRAFPGARLKIAIVAGEARNVLILPITAVAGQSDDGYVSLARDGQWVQRDVRLGVTDGVNVEIREGLAEGDRVRVPPEDPLGLLGDGS